MDSGRPVFLGADPTGDARSVRQFGKGEDLGLPYDFYRKNFVLFRKIPIPNSC